MNTACRIPCHLAIALTLCVSLAACDRNATSSAVDPAQAPATESHDAHASHVEPASALGLPDGQLWPTDAPLRTAMSRIQIALESSGPKFDAGNFGAADAHALAEAIESEVHYMIKNCRLPREPDAALHGLIARLLTAVNAMKSDPAAISGVPELTAVLDDYRLTFDHAGATL
jgi:hypothetical protein